MYKNSIVYGTYTSEYLADSIARKLEIPHGIIIRKPFDDGEMELQLTKEDEPRGRDVFVIGSTETADAQNELEDMIGGLRQHFGAAAVHAIVPFLGYSTAERSKPSSGVFSRGITRVQGLFGADPNSVLFFDLHAEGVKNSGGRRCVDHLYSEPMVMKILADLQARYGNIKLNSPDVGRGEWLKSLAGKAKLPFEILQKAHEYTRVEVGEAQSNFADHTAVIFDDMIRSGKSIVGATDSVTDAGAKNTVVIATHAVLPDGAEERLQNDNRIAEIHVTNSHPRSQRIVAPKYTVHDTTDLFAERIQALFPRSFIS